MSLLGPEAEREVVAEAARAPSVHNIQPARWRFRADGRVQLFRALDRALPAADPTGHDVRASLGAAFEGTALALARRGWHLEEPELSDDPAGAGLALVATAALARGDAPDPLAEWVGRRRAYRGRFRRPDAQVRGQLAGLEADDARVIADAAGIAALARAYDGASVHFLSRRDYEAELYRWMRFLPSHPDWKRDGLTAPCMALSPLEAGLAHWLLRPSIFTFVQRLGLARVVVSEAAAIRSAAAVILFCPPRAFDSFHVGRRFYRLWLQVTAAGCALCPLSALADHVPTASALEGRYRIPADRRVANAFRAGVAPVEPAASPRLPLEELIV